jgi:hypothetical protein
MPHPPQKWKQRAFGKKAVRLAEKQDDIRGSNSVMAMALLDHQDSES